MILHVANLDKFIPPFINLIRDNFDISSHKFWLTGDKTRYPYEKNTSIYQAPPGFLGEALGLIVLVTNLIKAEKIVLHGLFSIKITLILSSMPWLLAKCYWVILGGDLYARELEPRDWKWAIREPLRRFVIRRLGHLVTYIAGDVDLARKWYNAKGQYHECLVYTSNLYNPLPNLEFKSLTINILLGNSADPSNNHIELLEKILPYRDRNICIYAPLSYGNRERHAQQVIEIGKKWFGEKFKPITELMPFTQYLALLGKIDIAAFNHRRQQAMGNTITLIGLGKKVFIRNDVTPWGMLSEKEIAIFNIENFEITKLEPSTQLKNQAAVKLHFSKERLLAQLAEIFTTPLK